MTNNNELFSMVKPQTFSFLMWLLQSNTTDTEKKVAYWTEGSEILCKDEAHADALADFLECIGFEDVSTGYYDPEEDRRNGEIDQYTGWWYVDIA